MAKAKDKEPTFIMTCTIICGRFCTQNHAWRYYSIYDNLRTFGLTQEDANRIAKWAGRQKDNAKLDFGKIQIFIEKRIIKEDT